MIRGITIKVVSWNLILNHQDGNWHFLAKTLSLSRVIRNPIASKKLDIGKFIDKIAQIECNVAIARPLNSNFCLKSISNTKIHPPKNDRIKAQKFRPNSYNKMLVSFSKNEKSKEPIIPIIIGRSPAKLRYRTDMGVFIIDFLCL